MSVKPKTVRAAALPWSGDFGVRAREHLEFFLAWLRRPRQTASVVPSSRFLAARMVRDIDPDGARVLELGGGTGAFTREILATGLPLEKLEVVEINATFARGLERQFPGVDVIRHRAETISGHVSGGEGGYQRIVSGLPLLAINQETQRDILAEAFKLLAPGGVFVQFTYSALSPVNSRILDDLGLRAEKAGQILLNFPPATIFEFRRKSEETIDPA